MENFTLDSLGITGVAVIISFILFTINIFTFHKIGDWKPLFFFKRATLKNDVKILSRIPTEYHGIEGICKYFRCKGETKRGTLRLKEVDQEIGLNTYEFIVTSRCEKDNNNYVKIYKTNLSAGLTEEELLTNIKEYLTKVYNDEK